MKKALSLIEVLISVILISVVIGALLTIKSNNLTLLEKSKTNDRYNTYISILAYDYDSINNRNNNVFVSDKIEIKDDELKKEINSVKINIKDEIVDTKSIEDTAFWYKVYKSKFSIEDKVTKEFLTFRITDWKSHLL